MQCLDAAAGALQRGVDPRNGVGIVLPNFRGIARAVEELLEPAAYQRFRDATVRLAESSGI